MGSLAIQPPIVDHAAEGMLVSPLDELDDADFIDEVLRSGHSEEHLAQELIAKATALGISIPRPPSPVGNGSHARAESDATFSSSHARNTSSGSGETTDAAIPANQSERPGSSAGAPVEPTHPQPGPRPRSRSLNFSTYDKYLSQVEPNLCQPKFLKHTPAPTDSHPGIFGGRTRHSYISIKNGLKARVHWKKRPPTSGAML
ncbi:hypothetical protein VPNG_02727 [Cytospora leucostoma]|uniref:Uncharacterized protein n=1 Tax=Cytospora leucostoma TaxID=1230097 RepID=A0A423XIX8_9PEZI|nr:hypothetical protein VPNG_02727 [Cytospora leucostoma]